MAGDVKMRAEEFAGVNFSETVRGVLEELSRMFNKDLGTITKMAVLCKENNLKLTIIEPILNITKDCQPFLHEVGIDNAFNLFRGVSDSYADDINKRVRLDNRTPKSMDPHLFDNVNKYFTEIYGQPFRNSMLATGDQYHTRLFGRTYAVFPKGNFKFLWNDKVQDFNFSYSNFGRQLQDNDRIEGSMYSSDNRDLIGKLFLEEFVAEVDWHQIDLTSATAADVEIMIRCKSYYGINWDKFQDDEDLMIALLRMAQ